MITKHYKEPARDEITYTAGLFDGEGCVNIHKGAGKHRNHHTQNIVTFLNSTYQPVIQRLQNVWDIGYIQPTPAKGNKSPYWKWIVSSNDALWMLEHIYPYLCIKGKQTELAILYQKWLAGRGRRKKSLPEIQLDEDVFLTMKYFNQRPPPQDGIKLPVFNTLRELLACRE